MKYDRSQLPDRSSVVGLSSARDGLGTRTKGEAAIPQLATKGKAEVAPATRYMEIKSEVVVAKAVTIRRPSLHHCLELLRRTSGINGISKADDVGHGCTMESSRMVGLKFVHKAYSELVYAMVVVALGSLAPKAKCW